MNEYLNISQIENWLHGRLRGTVSNNVFAGNLPDVPDTSWPDMVEIDVVQVKDTSEYGRVCGEAIVNVFMYAKPNSKGLKNVSKLNDMESALAALITNDKDNHYIMTEMYSDGGYDRSIGYHYKITSLQIFIH